MNIREAGEPETATGIGEAAKMAARAKIGEQGRAVVPKRQPRKFWRHGRRRREKGCKNRAFKGGTETPTGVEQVGVTVGVGVSVGRGDGWSAHAFLRPRGPENAWSGPEYAKPR